MMQQFHSRSLILACGNPLRGDDGVAWRVVEALQADAEFNSVMTIVEQQWLPEHAEAVSRAEVVIFIDCNASGVPGEVREARTWAAETSPRVFTHHLDPASLLLLAQQLYGHAPSRAFTIAISGESFALREALSPRIIDAIPTALEHIRYLLMPSAKQ